MKKIQIPFPIYEGLEVKNATVDVENGLTIVEYGEKEPRLKRGDILTLSEYGRRWIIIFDRFNIDGRIHYFAMLTCNDVIVLNNSCDNHNYHLSQSIQKQKLFNALAKESKRWNAEKLCIELMPTNYIISEAVKLWQESETDIKQILESQIEQLTKIKSYLE